jgi:hypothetical protein
MDSLNHLQVISTNVGSQDLLHILQFMFSGMISAGAEQDPNLVNSFEAFGVRLKDCQLTQNSESTRIDENFEDTIKVLGLTQKPESSKVDAAGSGFKPEEDFNEPDFESDEETIEKAKLKRLFIF